MILEHTLIILVLCSAVMTLLGGSIKRQYGYPPLRAAAAYLAGVVGVGIYATQSFVNDTSHRYFFELPEEDGTLLNPLLRLMVAVLVYSPAIAYGALMLNGLAARFLVDTVYRPSAIRRPKSSYKRAWAMAHKGNTAVAVRLFRKYYEEDPTVPDPLFYMAQLLSHDQRHMEALQRYGEIMRRFARDESVWARAAFDCADLYELKLRQYDRARHLLESIVQRAKDVQLRELAEVRLGRLPLP